MGLRKASSYSKRRVVPYTRKSSKRTQSYIKSVPQSKIVKFNMGNETAFNNGKHFYVIRLISEQKAQIRDNSLESCRLLVNKTLDKLAPGNYYFIIKVYPHHIIRENKTGGGVAGADRLSMGMKQSFGTTVGRAAIVVPGKEIFFVSCTDEKTARLARDTLMKIKAKLPCNSVIRFQKIK